MSRRKKYQRPPPSPALLSRLARERRRQRLIVLVGLLAILIVVATVGLGYFYTSILPRWEAVATVNGTPIRTTYYAKLLRLTAGPSATDTAPLSQMALKQAIDTELILQRASLLGLSVTPQEIDDYLKVPAEPNPGEDEAALEYRFRTYLHQMGLSTEELRRIAEAILLREKAHDHFLGEVPKEAEQVHLFAIRVGDEEQARVVRVRLEAGEDFGAVATEVSLDDATKEKGGEMGWVPRGVLTLPELEDAVFALEPGTLSQPVAVATGYYIARVDQREVREMDTSYRDQLAVKAWQKWLGEQRESSQIVESLTTRRLGWAVARASK